MSDVFTFYVSNSNVQNGSERVLYSSNLLDHDVTVTEAKLTTEVNRAGSMNFSIYPTNPRFDELAALKTWVKVYRNSTEIWRGRILTMERGFWNNRDVYCEGMFGVLNDSLIPSGTDLSDKSTVQDILSWVINNHNSQVDNDAKLVLGTVNVSIGNETLNKTFDRYTVSMDYVLNEIVDVLGGYMTVVGNTLNYVHGATPDPDTKTLYFGETILDLTEKVDASNLFTVLYPFGKSNDSNVPLNISSVNNGKLYIQNDSAVSLFGRISKAETWSDIEDANTLKSTAQIYLDNSCSMSLRLDLTAVDKHLLTGNGTAIEAGSRVLVGSDPHGINSSYICEKIEYDFDNIEDTTYIFGYTGTTLSGMSAANEKSIAASGGSRSTGSSGGGGGGTSIQASDAVPLADTSGGSVGTSLLYSREDHIHPASAYLKSVTLSPSPSGSSYNIPLVTNVNSAVALGRHSCAGISLKTGTASEDGIASLNLGNVTSSGTSGNMYGRLKIYSRGSKIITIEPPQTVSNHATVLLPNVSGTLALLSDLPSGSLLMDTQFTYSTTSSNPLVSTSHGSPTGGVSPGVSNAGWYYIQATLAYESGSTTSNPVLVKLKKTHSESSENVGSGFFPLVTNTNCQITINTIAYLDSGDSVSSSLWTETAGIKFTQTWNIFRICT